MKKKIKKEEEEVVVDSPSPSNTKNLLDKFKTIDQLVKDYCSWMPFEIIRFFANKKFKIEDKELEMLVNKKLQEYKLEEKEKENRKEKRNKVKTPVSSKPKKKATVEEEEENED
jgi:hypothetical protein